MNACPSSSDALGLSATLTVRHAVTNSFVSAGMWVHSGSSNISFPLFISLNSSASDPSAKVGKACARSEATGALGREAAPKGCAVERGDRVVVRSGGDRRIAGGHRSKRARMGGVYRRTEMEGSHT